MKMKYLLILYVFVLFIGSVVAFNLVECFPLYSTLRQEARIDNHWLLIEDDGDSQISGYLSYPFKSGQLDVFYEGNNFIGEHLEAKSFVKLNNSWIGPYGYHFTGTSKHILIKIDGLEAYYKNVTVNGFYNPVSKQIYTRFKHDDLGMTWVTFINQGIRIKNKTDRIIN